MKKSEFYYFLPDELIAQEPIEKREFSKLLVLDKKTGEIEHQVFKDVIDYLNEGDCLVLNDTRVIPARLMGNKKDTNGAIEFVLLHKVDIDTWEVILRPGKKAKIGSRFIFGKGILEAEIIDILIDGKRLVKFYYEGLFENVLNEVGIIPLPPYIKAKLSDKERYQTVYSRNSGSSAAPTAGLHFTQELLKKIRDKGINIAYVTLHVGLGTFRPVKVDNLEEHVMHKEYYELNRENSQIINNTKKNNKKVVAVGTTVSRVLETIGDDNGNLVEKSGWTDIFIYPGYKYKVVDNLITNFHLPESTLIMLVSAFAGKDNVFKAYNQAIDMEYRFFSFGDAMLIK